MVVGPLTPGSGEPEQEVQIAEMELICLRGSHTVDNGKDLEQRGSHGWADATTQKALTKRFVGSPNG